MSAYTRDLIKYANSFEKDISVDIENGRFKVYISHIAVKDGYARPRAFGLGTTIEDACYDYIRRHRGLKLVNLVNEQEIEIL